MSGLSPTQQGALQRNASKPVFTFHPAALLQGHTCYRTQMDVFIKRSASQMEVNTEKTSSPELLSCGHGGGIHDKLLLKPKLSSSLQTEKVPRSSVLGRLQNFLPQMAAANDKLMVQIQDSPAGQFDIEQVEDAERVIEMDVALVELSGSEDEEEETSEEEEEDSSDEEQEVNLKLPSDGSRKKRANIQVLETKAQ
ncbi:uncharacterized protein C12orf45 homolog [Gadus macrocephalus]|uniref:uncharacterized protein C12orf45 homolog n=1 Tax=Gadus macrocephalus TaxID=80720 RepID=UPI0028CB8D51|nr:uncharacterized protein C12orf45 homolog [Gadus macrocephalus]